MLLHQLGGRICNDNHDFPHYLSGSLMSISTPCACSPTNLMTICMVVILNVRWKVVMLLELGGLWPSSRDIKIYYRFRDGTYRLPDQNLTLLLGGRQRHRAEERMGSTGARDVLAVAALLQSTAPDEQQLEDAANILSLKISSTKEILDWSLPLDTIKWRPLGDRILRWLLSKLDKQEAAPGNAIIDPSTYILLITLISNCPDTLVLRHVQHVDLSEIICKCLVYTRRELEQLQSVGGGNHERKSLKRKRSPDQQENNEAKRQQCLARLTSIYRLLHCLYDRSRFSGKVSSHVSTVRTILRASIRQAGLIVEAALWCMLMCIGHGASKMGLPIDNQLIRPFLSIWESVRTIVKPGDDLHSAVG